jgi:hypothetical protein
VRVQPLKRTITKPVALLQPGYRSLTMISEKGTTTVHGAKKVRALLVAHEKYRLYVDSGLTNLRHTTGALQWTAKTWRGRTTSMALDETKVTVTSLRGVLADATDPWNELTTALDWLAEFGVGPASPSTMAWNLWRATLTGNVSIAFDPAVGRHSLFGGRQEIREPRTYQHMAHVDLKAAYPFSMGNRPYALALEQVDPSTTLDPTVAGLAEARVGVPTDLPYAPLPIRVAKDMIQWQWGQIAGTWPWCELKVAQDLGCKVEVVRSWAPTREADLFSAWWRIIEVGRQLGGVAGKFLKMISNALWGIFGMVGDDRQLIAWYDDTGERSYVISSDNKRLPHANMAHIAAETTARVRSRLLSEGLYGAGGPGFPVHIDTDGVIVRKSRPLPSPSTGGAGDWCCKQLMRRVEIRAPQLYRWECLFCGVNHPEYHYVAAGSNASQAREIFRTTPEGKLQMSWRPMIDTVLPPANALEGGLLNAIR